MLPERQFISIRPPGWVNLYGLWMKCQTAGKAAGSGFRYSAAARVGVISARAVRMVTNSSPAVG